MSQTLENLLREDRTFPPPPGFAAAANAVPGIHEQAARDYLAFWKEQALERITWFKEPTVVLDDSNPPFYKWFSDGELNLSYNCLDRHLADHGDQIAYHWVGEPGDTRSLTYAQLAAEVNRLANGLKGLGLERGDRVAIYLGMIPELPVAMLACARLGLVHSVVFGGFSSEALSSRIIDADARVVITQDGAWRGGNIVPLKANTDRALDHTPGVTHSIVLKRTGHEVEMTEGRDIWWHDLVADQLDECEPVASGPRTRSTSCTPRGPPGSRRGSSTARRATSPGSPPPIAWSSTSSPTATSTGAPPTSVGSPVTATSSTGPWPTAPPVSSTRVPPTTPTSTVSGR
jgi:acetyl-CoA synthetase